MLKGESHLSRYETLSNGGSYVTFHELNVHIKLKTNNNSSQRELGTPVPHIYTVLRKKQVNFKARL